MDNIIYIIKEYIAMKKHYKEYHKENLYDVFTLFADEVFELDDIVSGLDYRINRCIDEGNSEINTTVDYIDFFEEDLLNEIADVIFTTARLIKEFNLEEPLIEMMEYKFNRQFIREENRKNGFK